MSTLSVLERGCCLQFQKAKLQEAPGAGGIEAMIRATPFIVAALGSCMPNILSLTGKCFDQSLVRTGSWPGF